MNELVKNLLAVLFASGEAVPVKRLAETLEVTPDEVREAAAAFAEILRQGDSPLEVLSLEDSYQLCVRKEFFQVVSRAMAARRNQPLSQAAMEVLAIVAYNQPVTRGFIDQIRGVDSSGVVSSLAEKGLIEDAGRLEIPGRPLAYKVTANFLRCFSLPSLKDLPPIPQDGEGCKLEVASGKLGDEESDSPEDCVEDD